MATGQSTFERTLADYFRERLQEISVQLDPAPHEDTLWYMGGMLARFGDSDQLFSFDQGELSIRPLALLYQDAHEADSHSERCLIVRQLGDLALFLGALFPENFARRGIHQDYFVGMGGGAYDYLSENARQNRHIFFELAATFARMLELVARVCCRQGAFDDMDILDLYHRWQQTGDPRLGDRLRALGVDVEASDLLH
jgi:hypothetical protein